MDTIALPPTVTFKMGECKLYFGGVPPDFDTSGFENLRFGNLLGSLRGITVSNPGSNSLLSPLYTQRFQPNPFYGVEPNCERKVCPEPLQIGTFVMRTFGIPIAAGYSS